MLQKLASNRSFEVLNAPSYRIAISEIETKFWDWMEKRPAASRCHDEVAKPFKRALERGDAPVMRYSEEDRKGADYYFIQLGPDIFPMRARKKDWNPAEVTIFPPLKEYQFKPKKFDEGGLSALYEKDVDKVESITVSREHAPTTHVRFKDGDTFHNESFGWAMWETATACIRRARAALKAEEPVKRFDPVMDHDVVVPKIEQYGKTVRALLGAMGKAAARQPLAGPPAAHDLLAAFSWNGRAVAVTSQRREDGTPIKLWVHERQGNGQLAWVEIPGPRDGRLPVHGANAVLDGSTLRIIGGVDKNGEPVKTHFAYDLGAGNRDRHRAELWRQEAPLEEGVAWPAVIATAREVLVGGGVAGFYVKAAEDRGKARNLAHRRDLKLLGRNGWKKRDPFKIEVTGASTAFGKGCAFIGPGSSMSGRVFVYDSDEEGASIELPKLPKDLGLGQLFLEGSKLVYAGGFEKGGAASTGVYELDLEDVEPKWKLLGQSPFAQGTARVVESWGNVYSIMIAPGKSAAYPVEEARW